MFGYRAAFRALEREHSRMLASYMEERSAHEREREAWAAERRDLLDRIMHMAGQRWGAPPEPEPPPGPVENTVPETWVVEHAEQIVAPEHWTMIPLPES